MDIKCENCGKDVLGVTKRRRFCSQKCADGNRYTPKPRVVTGEFRKCAYCGKDVWIKKCHQKYTNSFCCRKHNKLYQAENAHSAKCIVCGETFKCQPCQVKMRNRKTCSMKCRSRLLEMRGEGRRSSGSLTKHQIDRGERYSKKAGDWRKAVFSRDDYTCQDCGERGGYLEAHHVNPFAYFKELRYDLSNGKTLCKKCHNKTKLSAKEMRDKYGNKKTKHPKK